LWRDPPGGYNLGEKGESQTHPRKWGPPKKLGFKRRGRPQKKPLFPRGKWPKGQEKKAREPFSFAVQTPGEIFGRNIKRRKKNGHPLEEPWGTEGQRIESGINMGKKETVIIRAILKNFKKVE